MTRPQPISRRIESYTPKRTRPRYPEEMKMRARELSKGGISYAGIVRRLFREYRVDVARSTVAKWAKGS